MSNRQTGIVVAGIVLSAFFGSAAVFAQQTELPSFVRNGVAGFVVSHIQYALAGDAAETGACPAGTNQSYRDLRQAFINFPEVQREAGESDHDYGRRVRAVARRQPGLKSYCFYPEVGADNGAFKTVNSTEMPLSGIDLDGHTSTGEDRSPGSCPHQDFTASDGTGGIDNQFYRVVGCIDGYQSTGQANLFNIGQLTGSWGLLIRLSGVDDLFNDDSVKVSVFANGDPIRLSPQREPLDYATYTVHVEPRFHASSDGRIVDGVLTTGAMDVRFPYDVNAMYLDRVLRDARLQLTIAADGHAEGYLAGYAPVEDQYDLEYGYRSARVGTSEDSEPSPLPRRIQSAIGKARALGYTCEGIYSALYRQADGHYDPEKGSCTSISTQYQISVIPAFVLDRED